MHRSGDNTRQVWLWHRRLGHPSFSYLKRLFPRLFSNLHEYDFRCETCILAKSHRVPYPISLKKCETPFTLIHSDVWGPAPILISSGVRWFVTFVDDCTRMTWLYLMKNKSEVFGIFCSFHNMIKTQFSAKLQILRSDNGGEYDNNEFLEYFQEHGFYHETTCSQTPQQNGVAEPENRHILETTRALLIAANAPQHFWTDAVATAVYLLNRMPSRVLDFETPLEALAHYVPLPSILMLPPRIFGCVVYVHLHKNQRTKLDPCVVVAFFWGMQHIRKVIDAMTQLPSIFIPRWMSLFLSQKRFFQNQKLILLFRASH